MAVDVLRFSCEGGQASNKSGDVQLRVRTMSPVGVLAVLQTLLLLQSRVDTELIAKRKGGCVDSPNDPSLF